MKKYDENIEARVVETMALLDEMPPLEVHHLFRVRLMERVEEEFGEGARARGGNHLDFRLAFMALLLVVNLGSALVSVFDGNRQVTGGAVSELLDSQNDDYSSQEFAYYEQTAATTSPATETGGEEYP